jgi:hypothetical protein
LSERACGDNPSTDEEIKENRNEEQIAVLERVGGDEQFADEKVKEYGSERHFPIHPDEVATSLSGGHQTIKAFTLSERVGEDDPSVSGTSSSSSESSSEASTESSSESSSSSMSSECEEEDPEETEEEDELPPLIRIKDDEGEPPPKITEIPPISSLTWKVIEAGFESSRWGRQRRVSNEEPLEPGTFRQLPRWWSIDEGIERRHEKRHQAFRNRRSQVKQGTYVESLKDSPITG